MAKIEYIFQCWEKTWGNWFLMVRSGYDIHEIKSETILGPRFKTRWSTVTPNDMSLSYFSSITYIRRIKE